MPRTRPKRDKPIGESQHKVLLLLQDQPDLDVDRVRIALNMRNVHQATLALQGLVSRGFVAWKPGASQDDLLYFVTPRGRTKLTV